VPILKQGQLLGLGGIGGARTTQDHKPMRGLPTRRRVEELGHLPAVAQRLKGGGLGVLLDAAILARHDYIVQALIFQPRDEFARKATGVGPHANPATRNRRRHLGHLSYRIQDRRS